MHDLTSATDPRLAPYWRVGDASWLLRQGLFVAEGRLVVERLMDAKRFAIESILLTPAARHALAMRFEAVDAEVLVCSPETMKQVTGFNFHRGCLALARRPPIATIDSWLEREGVLLGLEAVGNPDNVGGLFRTAAAFGVSGIFVSPSTADPLYRKALRTSMGAVLQLPWSVAEPWPGAIAMFRSRGWRVAALAAADDRVTIPMAATVDSLNVTVAAGIALHALGMAI